MALSASFIQYAKDLFAPFGEIAVKRMFGGAGVYADGVIFAILGDGAIYFKVDGATRSEFEGAGATPFVYGEKGDVSMSYMSAPPQIFDDSDELARWTGLALAAARRKAKGKTKG